MPYRLLDLDLDHPLPAVTLAAAEDGVAVLVRRGGQPLGFWMEPRPAGSDVSAAELSERAASEVSADVVRHAAAAEVDTDDPAAPPSVTIAVCTHGRPERLARCLGAIQALRVPAGASAPDVLVVDNAPPDERTRALVDRAPGVRYAREPRTGLDFARNRAIQEATGRWLAFLDDDVVADPGWLEGLAQAVAVHPDAAAVTGLVLPFALETEAQILFEQSGGFRRGFRPLRYRGSTLPGNRLYPTGPGIFGAGANMAFRLDALRAIGGFDEALDTGAPLPGGGDLDIFYRVIRSGEPLVYWPAALVFHEHRRELDALRQQYHSWGTGFMAFVTKAYRTDPPQREKLRAMVGWWFRNQLRQLRASARGRHALPPAMLLAELRGGVQGLAGEYGRSQRRVARIRQQQGVGVEALAPAAP